MIYLILRLNIISNLKVREPEKKRKRKKEERNTTRTLKQKQNENISDSDWDCLFGRFYKESGLKCGIFINISKKDNTDMRHNHIKYSSLIKHLSQLSGTEIILQRSIMRWGIIKVLLCRSLEAIRDVLQEAWRTAKPFISSQVIEVLDFPPW